MSNKKILVTLDTMNNIANSIKAKLNMSENEKIKINELSSKIDAISTGSTGEIIIPQVFNETELSYASYKEIITSKVVKINATTIGSYCFQYCCNIEEAYLPNVITIDGYFMSYCNRLRKVDIGENCTSIGGSDGYFLAYSIELETLILRNPNTTELKNFYNLMNSRCLKYQVGNHTFENYPAGHIYVPAVAYDSYMALPDDSGWGFYKSNIRKIEDYPEICQKKYEGV